MFDLGSYVVKLPRYAFGFDDNEWEGSIDNIPEGQPGHDPDNVQYARTHLVFLKRGDMNGEQVTIPVLFMERLNTDIWKEKRYKDFPDWVGYVDGGQVGYDRRGKLVAFDYGYR